MSTATCYAMRGEPLLIITALVTLIGVGVSPSVARAVGPGCPDSTDFYAQCPNLWFNGADEEWIAYSDLAVDETMADDFVLDSPASIARIRCWSTLLLWGSDAGCAPLAPDDFTLHIWGDDAGNPNGTAPIPLPSYVVTRSTDPVGEILAGLGTAPVYEYEFVFDADRLELDAGVRYWIEIQNDTSICAWAWLTAPNPPGDGTSRERQPSSDPNWANPVPRGFDLAFSLLARAPAVPATSQWGMVITMLLLSGIATVVFRRGTRFAFAD